ncbi:MAG: class I SAM-dependent DNA methyltransferase [Alphaproteobacteria bacterium]
MDVQDFIRKWRGADDLKERADSQQQFLDLCAVLEVPKPRDPGYPAKDYNFERTVKKQDGTPGQVDVWKRGCFAWEFKGPKKSLVAAYSQVKTYADALDNPPLLIVSDMREIQVHTNFNDTVKRVYAYKLADLNDFQVRQKLAWAFTDPDKLKPDVTREGVTEEAAASIGALATKLRSRKHEARRVAHFLNKLVFCMFAEDIGLLPGLIFSEVMEETSKQPDLFEPMVKNLFRAMRDKGGLFGTTPIPWFNGGLFDDDEVLPIGQLEINDILKAALLDWSAIEPSIFGTLFERGLDPDRRKEMASLFDAKADTIQTSATRDLFDGKADKAVGVHYTDPEKIMKIVEPVVLRPLRLEWDEVKKAVAKHRAAKEKAKSPAAKTKAENEARDAYLKFRARLGAYRVLDPACGSGNFLYMALMHLKDLDRAILDEAKTLALPADNERVTPDAVMGIEINPYAAELAQVTIWIGEIQWKMKFGGGVKRSPILGRLANIACRDALLKSDGKEASWPKADAIIGNPPFLGAKKLFSRLGKEYVGRLRLAYEGRVTGFSDLVGYWFEKARKQIANGLSSHAGLVATNSIRGGTNRYLLTRLVNDLTIFDAWADEPWVVEGASVRVSIVAFTSKERSKELGTKLNGAKVNGIADDLTSLNVDELQSASAVSLKENSHVAFLGIQKTGPFDIEGDLARKWLVQPINPNGRPNADVLKPYWNGLDVVRRPRDRWIVDFGVDRNQSSASEYEEPFEFLKKFVQPTRVGKREERANTHWWLHYWARPEMRAAISILERFIVTPEVSKYRLFVWMRPPVLPDKNLIVMTREDDCFFGLLHSKIHTSWSLKYGTSLEDRPRYTSSTTFETFPFPEGLTPNKPASQYENDPRARRIAAAAAKLNELRENWLNPADLVRREPEVVPGYPDRILPVSDKAAAELKKRTLTNLYNQRPTWLANAHKELDDAVAAAYGWPADLVDDEILARLLKLNLERAAAGR